MEFLFPKRSPWRLGMAAVYFFSHVCAAHAGEKSFWADRAAAREGKFPLAAGAAVPLAWNSVEALPAPAGVGGAWGKTLSPALAVHGVIRTQRWSSRPEAPLVIQVQDAHGAVEAQRNIAALVETLRRERGVSLVALEGAAGPFDLSPYRGFPDPALTREVADHFLRRGVLTGVEFAGLTADQPLALFGAEDMALYRENEAAVRSALAARADRLARLARVKATVDALKDRWASPGLKAFDRLSTGYRDRSVSLGNYVRGLLAVPLHHRPPSPNLELLRNILDRESALDFSAIEAERRRVAARLTQTLSPAALNLWIQKSLECRSGRLSQAAYQDDMNTLCRRVGIPLSPDFQSYLAYLRTAEGLNRDGLLTELAALETAVQDALADTPEGRHWVALDRAVGVLEKLFTLSLTTSEWERYPETRKGVAALGENIAALNPGAAPPLFTPDDLTPFENFFALAVRRNGAMVDRLLARMAEGRTQAAVLVAGGFHTEGVTRLLTARGVSSLVITPRVGTVAGGNAYVDIFTADPVPLEKWLSADKVTLVRRLTLGPTDNAVNQPVQQLLEGVLKVIHGVVDRFPLEGGKELRRHRAHDARTLGHLGLPGGSVDMARVAAALPGTVRWALRRMYPPGVAEKDVLNDLVRDQAPLVESIVFGVLYTGALGLLSISGIGLDPRGAFTVFTGMNIVFGLMHTQVYRWNYGFQLDPTPASFGLRWNLAARAWFIHAPYLMGVLIPGAWMFSWAAAPMAVILHTLHNYNSSVALALPPKKPNKESLDPIVIHEKPNNRKWEVYVHRKAYLRPKGHQKVLSKLLGSMINNQGRDLIPGGRDYARSHVLRVDDTRWWLVGVKIKIRSRNILCVLWFGSGSEAHESCNTSLFNKEVENKYQHLAGELTSPEVLKNTQPLMSDFSRGETSPSFQRSSFFDAAARVFLWARAGGDEGRFSADYRRYAAGGLSRVMDNGVFPLLETAFFWKGVPFFHDAVLTAGLADPFFLTALTLIAAFYTFFHPDWVVEAHRAWTRKSSWGDFFRHLARRWGAGVAFGGVFTLPFLTPAAAFAVSLGAHLLWNAARGPFVQNLGEPFPQRGSRSPVGAPIGIKLVSATSPDLGEVLLDGTAVPLDLGFDGTPYVYEMPPTPTRGQTEDLALFLRLGLDRWRPSSAPSFTVGDLATPARLGALIDRARSDGALRGALGRRALVEIRHALSGRRPWWGRARREDRDFWSSAAHPDGPRPRERFIMAMKLAAVVRAAGGTLPLFDQESSSLELLLRAAATEMTDRAETIFEMAYAYNHFNMAYAYNHFNMAYAYNHVLKIAAERNFWDQVVKAGLKTPALGVYDVTDLVDDRLSNPLAYAAWQVLEAEARRLSNVEVGKDIFTTRLVYRGLKTPEAVWAALVGKGLSLPKTRFSVITAQSHPTFFTEYAKAGESFVRMLDLDPLVEEADLPKGSTVRVFSLSGEKFYFTGRNVPYTVLDIPIPQISQRIAETLRALSFLRVQA